MRYIVLVVASLAVVSPTATAQRPSAEVATVIEDLVAANRILAAQGILPGYGHVSVRHPEDSARYFMSRSLAPELVTAEDIVEFDLDSVAVDSKGYSFYLERFIHGEIYRARPDVQAVIHNHSPTVISFGIGSTSLRPVYHQAAFFLDGVPIWDYRDFGTADGALVDDSAKGRALAVKLANRPAVLMRNHGVAVVGSSLPMVVGRSVVLEKNAQMQSQVLSRGDTITYLELDEEPRNNSFDRAWDLWKRQVSTEGR
jgi:HCOMODA/2-hydroxy-3-carboxy-muconic semialdehyde decarboxylase